MKKIFLFILLNKLAIAMAAQPSPGAEDSLRNFFTANKDSLNPIEGLWIVHTTHEFYHSDTLYDVVKNQEPSIVALKNSNGKFRSFNISGESFEVEFTQTDVKSVYFIRNYYSQPVEAGRPQAVISKKGEMEYTYDLPPDVVRTKLGEKYNEQTRIVNILKWTKTFPEN